MGHGESPVHQGPRRGPGRRRPGHRLAGGFALLHRRRLVGPTPGGPLPGPDHGALRGGGAPGRAPGRSGGAGTPGAPGRHLAGSLRAGPAHGPRPAPAPALPGGLRDPGVGQDVRGGAQRGRARARPPRSLAGGDQCPPGPGGSAGGHGRGPDGRGGGAGDRRPGLARPGRGHLSDRSGHRPAGAPAPGPAPGSSVWRRAPPPPAASRPGR